MHRGARAARVAPDVRHRRESLLPRGQGQGGELRQGAGQDRMVEWFGGDAPEHPRPTRASVAPERAGRHDRDQLGLVDGHRLPGVPLDPEPAHRDRQQPLLLHVGVVLPVEGPFQHAERGRAGVAVPAERHRQPLPAGGPAPRRAHRQEARRPHHLLGLLRRRWVRAPRSDLRHPARDPRAAALHGAGHQAHLRPAGDVHRPHETRGLPDRGANHDLLVHQHVREALVFVGANHGGGHETWREVHGLDRSEPQHLHLVPDSDGRGDGRLRDLHRRERGREEAPRGLRGPRHEQEGS
mmetsp:Transcript_96446/g.251403  ORF Transcript_96446/g.251403 Transcript_96446/m.251403 type:complete len:296 (-) Transcript_96446:246-1133(-)